MRRRVRASAASGYPLTGSAPCPAHELIERGDDPIGFPRQRIDGISQCLLRYRDDLQRMESNGHVLDLESGIQARMRSGAELRLSDERNHDSTVVSLENRRLHDDDEGNAVALLAAIAVNVELRHYSVECSSAKDPNSSSKRFHIAAVASANFTSAA